MWESESFWAQVGQAVFGLCALIGGVILLVAIYELLQPVLTKAGHFVSPAVGPIMAGVFMLMLFVIAGGFGASQIFNAYAGRATRPRWLNVGHGLWAFLASLISLFFMAMLVEVTINVF